MRRLRLRERRRGVSPIVAMVLLVAISCVLGAVLYVLVSGLAHGPTQSPIGYAFAMGGPVTGTCTAAQVAALTCATSGDRIFTFQIEQSSVTLGDVLLEVKAASGGPYTNPMPGDFVIETNGGAEVASYIIGAGPGFAMASVWTHFAAGNTASTHILTSMAVVVDTGVSASAWAAGQGNTLTAIGTGHFSGTTAPVALP